MASQQPVFTDLSADGDSALNSETTEIESLCMSCGDNGITKLLLTRIPHYREVILMSFSCQHCGLRNNEIQPGGRVQEKGVRVSIRVEAEKDLSRQIVKGDHGSIRVPEIDLEIPEDSQKGTISTIEGVLERTIEGLSQDQPVRRIMDPEGAGQIDQYVDKIRRLLDLKEPFHFILRDPSGNSYVENLLAPAADPQREETFFVRTKEEDHALAIYTREEIEERQNDEADTEVRPETIVEENEDPIGKEEILCFPTNCSNCNAPAETNMKLVDIPHFKEVVIMATSCDFCGHKTNEVKSGGGIEPKGTKITLRVKDPSDLSRDVLKSETCSLKLPDLDFEMGGYCLGGKFTTLEGLLSNIMDQMESNPFMGSAGMGGDSTTPEAKQRLTDFSRKFRELMTGNKEFVFILDDPAGNSYLQNVYAPDQDPEMDIEHYERTYDQNDELGINDMKTENYGEKDETGGVL